MTVLLELLRSLKLRGVHLWSDGQRVLYRCRDGSLSADDLDLLSEHRSELLTLLGRVSIPGQKTITTASRDQPLPLSFAQQRLWFLSRVEGSRDAYHVPLGLQLKGRLDEASLRRALDRLVYRHESLRTTFGTNDDEPFQQIGPETQGLEWVSHDLVGQVDVETALIALMKSEASAPFDLERGPLIRGRLIRVAVDEHVLLLTMHHIVVDGWSLGVLTRELSALYEVYAAGGDDPLTPLTIQYADYAVWQRRWLSRDVLADQATYWREALAGAPAVLELPKDRNRPARQDYSGAFVALELDETLTASLKALSQRHGTTLFMTVLAGWALLLSRLSGQEDVVIGAPSANRNHQQLEGLIGFFVNTLVLRVDLSGAPTVEELLGRVKAVVLGAQANQDLPFEQVVEIAKPPRSLAHAPLFQVMLAWQNNDVGRLEMPGLSIAGADTTPSASKFDLTLGLSESGGRIAGSFEYATALFERETLERWGEYLRKTLEEMAREPTRVAATLPLLSAAERHRLLVEWNATQTPYPDRCVHELFESQAERDPAAAAVIHEDKSLTYGELNRRANQLAHHLRSLGVGPDVLVAICVERSLEMVIGLLAILKAGGAYVPLDPAYPAERLRYMLKDSAPAALLIHGATRAALDTVQGSLDTCPPLIDLDTDTRLWTTQRSENPDARAVGLTSRHLAYVIYTSGSTGQPKGVMVEHANVTRLFASTQQWFHFDHVDVWTLFHSFAFDFSVWEIWGALLYGGRLVVVPQPLTRSPDELYELLCREGVTVLNQTPSAFRQLLAAQGRSAQRHRLRQVIFGGEALEVSTLEPWYERAENRQTQLVNMYGITEITVHGTYRALAAADATSPAGNSPIGSRLPDLKLYILGQDGEPVPLGVAGEIYVGGAGVTRGYLNRPSLTAERFVSDPFSAVPGARMYRSGDRGRYLPNGEIEYLGRADHQVKIRGFRIEPGEIEAKLRNCADVREAVVLAREDAPGEKRLVAYVVGRAGASIRTRELHESLQAELAEYMMPSAYVVLNNLPLTQNGKLDRNALPPPEDSAMLHRDFEPPAGEAEQVLAQVWQQILGLERVGRRDHFFELGGHSLLVIRMLDQLRQRGLNADVAAVFTSPTLSALAVQLKKEEVEDRDADVPANRISVGCARITPELLPLVSLTQRQIDALVNSVPGGVANVQDIYPLSQLQQGILFHHVLGSERGGDAYLLRSVVAFDSRDGLQRFLNALQRVIDRHDILRSAIFFQGLQEPVQVVYRQATLVVEEHKLTGDVLEQLLTRTDPRRTRMDLRLAPLFRAHVAMNPSRGEWLLVLLNHHIIEDNYSLRLVLDEVQQIVQGTQERLPEPLPYRNFIARACAPRPSEHENYFREQLRDVAEPTAPFGVLDVRGSGAGVSEAEIALSGELAQRVRQVARAQSVSSAVLFHVVWAQVLAECSGRDDVVFGTVLSGRLQNARGADRAIGMFINTLPFRLPLQNLSVSAAVRECYERLSRIVAHEQAPLALAQRCGGVPASLPLFTALLNCRLGNEIRLADEISRSQQAWAGIRLLRSEERTNYPLYLSVDDLGDDFALRVQSVTAIDAARVGEYVRSGMHALLETLASAPHRLTRTLKVLPAGERHGIEYVINKARSEWSAHAPASQAYEPPVGDVEQAIARLWEKLLDVSRVGRHDHFFDLGGHSLLAMKMIQSIQNDLNLSVSLATFFSAPTPATLARKACSGC